MKQEISELRQIKGVGETLAKRFTEAGFDTIEKLASADQEELGKIPKVSKTAVSTIAARARELVEGSKTRAAKVEELRQRAASLKSLVLEMAVGAREYCGDELMGNTGARFEKQMGKFLASLEKVEGMMGDKVGKMDKRLVTAEKRLEAFAEGGLSKACKRLKRARKSLQKLYG